MTTENKPKHGGRAADFFAGIGLAELGLELAGWNTVFANDKDPKKQQLYRDNRSDHVYCLEDIFHLTPNDVPDCDLAWASFPCIDVSLAGNLRGLAGKHSGAFWGFRDLIDRMGSRRPPILVVENVLGLISHNGGLGLVSVVRALSHLGYRCDVVVVDAARFVPQSRPRVFIVAALDAPFIPVTLLTPPSDLRPKRVLDIIVAHPDLAWGIFFDARLPNLHAVLDELVESVPDDSPLWFSPARTEQLLGQVSVPQRAKLEPIRGAARWTHLPAYRRVRKTGCMTELRFDGVAGCLRTAVGGSSRQLLLVVGHGILRMRWMTPREYARLQGVPESFKIDRPVNQALHAFGDAVCVPVVEWLAKKALNPMFELMCLSSGSNNAATIANTAS